MRDTKEESLNMLENWIKEVVAKNADGKTEQIPSIVKERFHLSMQANEEYHKDFAASLGKSGDGALISYHNLMSEIYKMLCRK